MSITYQSGLLGIVRTLNHRHEAEPINEALIRERLTARDRFLAPLVAERDAILAPPATRSAPRTSPSSPVSSAPSALPIVTRVRDVQDRRVARAD